MIFKNKVMNVTNLLFRIVAAAMLLACGKSGSSFSNAPHKVDTVSTVATAFEPKALSVSPPISMDTSGMICKHNINIRK